MANDVLKQSSYQVYPIPVENLGKTMDRIPRNREV